MPKGAISLHDGKAEPLSSRSAFVGSRDRKPRPEIRIGGTSNLPETEHCLGSRKCNPSTGQHAKVAVSHIDIARWRSCAIPESSKHPEMNSGTKNARNSPVVSFGLPAALPTLNAGRMTEPILVPARSSSSISISVTPDTSAFCARSADAVFRWIGTGAIVEVHTPKESASWHGSKTGSNAAWQMRPGP